MKMDPFQVFFIKNLFKSLKIYDWILISITLLYERRPCIWFLFSVLAYGDDASMVYGPCNRDENTSGSNTNTISLFGIPLVGSPMPSWSRLWSNPPPENAVLPGTPVGRRDYGYSLRVVELHVISSGGDRCQLPPVISLQCSRMLNRVLGILFQSDSREVPREVRCLFKICK